jgi:hypothetical protein
VAQDLRNRQQAYDEMLRRSAREMNIKPGDYQVRCLRACRDMLLLLLLLLLLAFAAGCCYCATFGIPAVDKVLTAHPVDEELCDAAMESSRLLPLLQVQVHIIQVQDLKPEDLNGLSDPVVYVGGQHRGRGTLAFSGRSHFCGQWG